jgi:hypothetical protein
MIKILVEMGLHFRGVALRSKLMFSCMKDICKVHNNFILYGVLLKDDKITYIP